MNPEVGHMLMAYEDLTYAISPEQTEAALYALKMHGYRGYFGIDINPEHMPVDVAPRNNMDALRAANDRINALDHEQVLWATEHPDRARGWLGHTSSGCGHRTRGV